MNLEALPEAESPSPSTNFPSSVSLMAAAIPFSELSKVILVSVMIFNALFPFPLPKLRHPHVIGVAQYAECGEQPDDDTDDHHDVEDLFNLGIHGDIGINEPQDYADYDESYYEGY